jgi:hypothetical protein
MRSDQNKGAHFQFAYVLAPPELILFKALSGIK